MATVTRKPDIRHPIQIQEVEKLIYGMDTDGNFNVIAVDTNGNLQVEVLASIHMTEIEYVPVDDDSTSSPKYYSFMDKDGNYFIMKESVSGSVTSIRYWKPSALDYATDWAARAAKSYDLPSIF